MLSSVFFHTFDNDVILLCLVLCFRISLCIIVSILFKTMIAAIRVGQVVNTRPGLKD